jgi:hypothetical protein
MYKVYGGNKKKVPNADTNFKGKYIDPDRLHADGIKKTAIKGKKYERRNLYGRKLPPRRYTMPMHQRSTSNCKFGRTSNIASFLTFEHSLGRNQQSSSQIGHLYTAHERKVSVMTKITAVAEAIDCQVTKHLTSHVCFSFVPSSGAEGGRSIDQAAAAAVIHLART